MAGRKLKHQEFLRTLRDVVGLDGADFARAIGKQHSNVSQYMSGTKDVGKKTLRSAVFHLGEWNVTPIFEVEAKVKNLGSIPQTPGIYALYDSSSSILYVGQATRLRDEIRQTLNRQTNFPVRSGPKLAKKPHPKYKDIAERLSAYEVPSPRLRHNLEALLLRMFPNQSHNSDLEVFK